jgi:hypothetical protein
MRCNKACGVQYGGKGGKYLGSGEGEGGLSRRLHNTFFKSRFD